MEIKFLSVELPEIQEAVEQHVVTFSAPIDSFIEDHIFESKHYRIQITGKNAGFASIHEESLITQYSLKNAYKSYGQEVFRQLRKMEKVQAAFVPTCDEFFLAHALDDYRQLYKQAYFFMANDEPLRPGDVVDAPLNLATEQDIDFIKEQSGDFFGDIERMVRGGEIYIALQKDEGVGFGVLVRSKLYRDVASIGMYTIERFRNAGAGTQTIKLLIRECRKQNIQPVAGCWYYNHLSKKTLERAGMYSQTRLLKIEY